MKIRVLLADKEATGRQRLRHLLGAEPGTEIVGECVSGTETLEAIGECKPDVVFLDVELADRSGFSVVEALRPERLPAIVFLAPHDGFAVRAYEIRAVDYLLKPYDVCRFQVAMRRAMEWIRKPPGLLTRTTAANPAPSRENLHSPERIVIKSRGKITLLKVADIHWIGAADNYLELHLGDVMHLVRLSIRAALEQLPKAQFVRISRSKIVHIDRIKEIISRAHGDCFVQLDSGIKLSGSRRYRANLARLVKHSI